jgi:hypothetical protein
MNRRLYTLTQVFLTNVFVGVVVFVIARSS